MKHFRMLAAGLCSAVLLCGSAIPAYAYSDSGNEEPPVVEETPAPEPAPTITPGEGFSEDGNLVTRDLLYDAATNKQFITVETSGGNTFYIVIDYDKPVDEDGEQYQTYFLNTVDEADLLAAAEAAGVELASCSCPDKCAAGAVNTNCAVCAVNMTECAGVEQKPEPEPEPVAEPDAEPETEKGNAGMLLLVLAVAVLGGGEYALHEVQALLPVAKSVALLTNGAPLTADFPPEVTVYSQAVEAVLGETVVTGVQLSGGVQLPVSGVFVALGVAGSTALARKIGAEVDGNRIVVDARMQTTVPGLYAAGDCTGGLLQVAKAVYEGAQAGTEAAKALRKG